jgi:hypothetical protein
MSVRLFEVKYCFLKHFFGVSHLAACIFLIFSTMNHNWVQGSILAWHRLDPISIYRVFRGFRQAKFANGGSIFGSSQFTELPQLPLKTMLSLRMVKID